MIYSGCQAPAEGAESPAPWHKLKEAWVSLDLWDVQAVSIEYRASSGYFIHLARLVNWPKKKSVLSEVSMIFSVHAQILDHMKKEYCYCRLLKFANEKSNACPVVNVAAEKVILSYQIIGWFDKSFSFQSILTAVVFSLIGHIEWVNLLTTI